MHAVLLTKYFAPFRAGLAASALIGIGACSGSGAPSDGMIKQLIVEGSDVFEPGSLTINVQEGIVRTDRLNTDISADELLSYLKDEGYFSVSEVIKEDAEAPVPGQANGSLKSASWLYARSYSKVELAQKLKEYIKEDGRVESTLVQVKVANQPTGMFSQRIPWYPLRNESSMAFEVELPVYETKFEKIVRTKDTSEISASCDLSVEYEVKRELTTFGKVAPERIRNFKETEELSACLAKYEDGWRFQNPGRR